MWFGSLALGLITALAGLVSFRVRGGWLVKLPSTQLARLVDALTVTVLFLCLAKVYYGQWDWANSLVVLVLSFCSLIVGWFSSIDIGRNEGSPLKDFYVLSLRGLFLTLPVGLWLLVAGFWLPVAQYPLMWLYGLSGSLAGVLYGISWNLNTPLRFHGKYIGLEPGPEQGEALVGLVRNSLLFVSMFGGQNL